MSTRVSIRARVYGCLFSTLIAAAIGLSAQKSDPFIATIHETVAAMPAARSGLYAVPTDAQLRDWTTIFQCFRSGALDSCRTLLDRYDYELTAVHDPVGGGTYSVIRERTPIRRGWGTYIHNPNYRKRLFVHVTHPVDDGGTADIGAELFRKSGAQWLLIAGTTKGASLEYNASDVARSRRSVFQRWHELLTDLTHVSLSIHGFQSSNYDEHVGAADIIVSNGRTSDDQWGVSQISLAYRDTLAAAGIRASIAMYDSGFSRLAGGSNPQGVFANDSAGFGHWINVEISERVRNSGATLSRFIAATDRAFALTGKRVAQQLNRDFGLVSPRVVKIDSLSKMLFAPSRPEGYKIVSFQAAETPTDTAHVVFGGWLNFGDGPAVTRVLVDTSTGGDLAGNYRSARRRAAAQVTRVVEGSGAAFPGEGRVASAVFADSSADDDAPVREPIQVHRIPLQAVLVSTMMNETSQPTSAGFRWEGSVSERFIPALRSFQMAGGHAQSAQELRGIPNFLIPLIRSSYDAGAKRFVGVQMTSLLVNEIARLVNEHQIDADDVRLCAEESPTGDYFLRVFPAAQVGSAVVQNAP